MPAKIKVSQINLSYDCRAVKWGFVPFHLAPVLSGNVSSERCASLTTKSYKLFTLSFLKLVLLERKGKFTVTGQKSAELSSSLSALNSKIWERWYTLVVKYLYTLKDLESGVSFGGGSSVVLYNHGFTLLRSLNREASYHFMKYNE